MHGERAAVSDAAPTQRFDHRSAALAGSLDKLRKLARVILSVMVLAAVTSACAGDSGSGRAKTSPAVAVSPAKLSRVADAGGPGPARSVLISPYTMPKGGFAACQDAFNLTRDYHEYGSAIGGFKWSFLLGTDPEADYAGVIVPFETMFEMPTYRGLGRMYLRDATKSGDRSQLDIPKGYPGARTFTNPAVAQAYIDEAVWFANRFPSDYLALGAESNGYYDPANPGEWDAFVAAYTQAYDQIKSAHPNLKVFIYFQLELLHRDNRWDIVTAQLLSKLDVIAFSSYPSSGLHNPNFLTTPDLGYDSVNIPASYYRIIETKYPGKPILFAEIAHPSEPSAVFSRGSPQEQADFVDRFYDDLISGMNVELVNWMGLHEIEWGNEYFSSIALRNDNGSPKTAWDHWIAR